MDKGSDMTAPPREPRPDTGSESVCKFCGDKDCWYGACRAPAPSADQDQNGGQGHEAYVHCSLGALPLESGNAREATCLNTEPSARTGTDTQQGQLGANAGSIPAPPTSTPAAQPAEPPAMDDLVRHLRSASGYPPFVNGYAADLIERQAREIARWNELHRVIAEELDCDQETWPDHRNAPLAIGATFVLIKQRAERAEAERDALRECVAELAGAVETQSCTDPKCRVCAVLKKAYTFIDAARAKVKP